MRRHSIGICVLLGLASCARCPEYGIEAPGSYVVRLDSQSTVAMSCTGVDTLATGDTVPIHFAINNGTVARCQGWIDVCGPFTATRFNVTGPMSNAPFVGTFDVTLASGCTGDWQASISESGGVSTLYFFDRLFTPDNAPECHAQFGDFVRGTSPICADRWVSRVMPAP
jgi:hypothetical protein